MSLLDEDNVCGCTVLRLVSRGSAIVAEILRMRDHVELFSGSLGRPVVSSSDTGTGGATSGKAKEGGQLYDAILFDFKYLKSPQQYEDFISSSEKLLELDETFQENHLSLLERLYLLFESIYKYVSAYNKFIADLQAGFYIQHTLVGVLLDPDGKQLVIEALYLYGVMLLLLDRYFPGPLRERIVTAYLRCKGEASLLHIDHVVTLCRTADRAIDLFKRFPVDMDVVEMVISRLKSDDLYRATTVAFPAPEHRSIALANQASMLFVVLHFMPKILVSNHPTMREVVDKYFNDNWIIPIYMGIWVDLQAEWCMQAGRHSGLGQARSGKSKVGRGGGQSKLPVPAAASAMKNILNLDHVGALTERYKAAAAAAQSTLDRFLTKGILTEQFTLDNTKELLNCLRNANSTLRWFLLQRKSADPVFRPLVHGAVEASDLMHLLLSVSEVEVKVKDILKRLLEERGTIWEECKKQCSQRMAELSNYFTGNVALTRIQRDDTLVQWFKRLQAEIDSLDIAAANPTFVGRRIQKVIDALEDVEQYNEIDTNLQIKQFLADSRDLLIKMVRVVGLDDRLLSTIEVVTDMSYAWEIMDDYRDVIHGRIRKDPQAVNSLRAVFLKLSSILDIPMVRITQANSPDLNSVAAYYSHELMRYVRRVLEVIPQTVFRILAQLIELQTGELKPLPIKIETQSLSQSAQMEQRYELARLTYLVSVFTRGIVSMANTRTILGVIEVDPKAILRDGIRQELVLHIAEAMNDELRFELKAEAGSKVEQVERRLERLSERLQGFMRSFEYIQDYINIYGLQMWQQEYSRVVLYNVEQECNKFLKRKILDKHSQYQSVNIPIPRTPPQRLNFIGRMEQALLDLTIPGPAVFSLESFAWYDDKEDLLLGLQFWATLHRALGVVGIAGIDRLMSFRLTNLLHQCVREYTHKCRAIMPLLHQLHGELQPENPLPKDGMRSYITAIRQPAVSTITTHFLSILLQIGQVQLLRQQISNDLRTVLQAESSQVYSSLETCNRAILQHIKQTPGIDTTAVCALLKASGQSAPLEEVYITAKPCNRLAELLFAVVMAAMPRLSYRASLDTLCRRNAKEQPLDGMPLICGVWTLLKQFHPSVLRAFCRYMAIFVQANIMSSVGAVASVGSKDTAMNNDPAVNSVHFLQGLCAIGKLPRTFLAQFLPPGIETYM